MIHAIAIKVRDNAFDTLRLTRLHFDTECEETSGRGVKFDIDYDWIYSDTDGVACRKFSAWDYLNGYSYRQRFNIKDFWPICVYEGYVYGFQDSDKELYCHKHAGSKLHLGSEGTFWLSKEQFDAILAVNDIETITPTMLEYVKSLLIDLTNSYSVSSVPFSSNNAKDKEKDIMNLNVSNSLLKNLRCGKAGEGFGISLLDGNITYKGHSYDGKSLVETAGFEINAGDFLFILPCTEIKKGDIVAINNDAAYYDGKSFISLTSGAKTEYVPVSCFGMTFYSVVRNMLGNFTGSANNTANLLPLLLLDKSGDSDDLMKLMLLMNGGLNFNFGAAAPAKTSK